MLLWSSLINWKYQVHYQTENLCLDKGDTLSVPHTEDAAFVKIFRNLLTEEEASWAMNLTDSLMTPKQLAEKSNCRLEKAKVLLEKLSQKGVAFEQQKNGVWYYRLSPYCPGIVESLISKDLNTELSGYLQEYMDELEIQRIAASEKIIALDKKIRTETIKIPYNEVLLYLDQTSSYSLSDCLCRAVNKLNGKDCGHPIKDMCIQIGPYAEYYIRTGRARRATRKEIEDVLKYAESKGLYHEVYPADESYENAFICNCCACGCLFMRLSGRIRTVTHTEDPILIQKEKCTGCKICIEECPGQALSWDINENIPVLKDYLCFTCGLCSLVCPNHAIQLK